MNPALAAIAAGVAGLALGYVLARVAHPRRGWHLRVDIGEDDASRPPDAPGGPRTGADDR